MAFARGVPNNKLISLVAALFPSIEIHATLVGENFGQNHKKILFNKKNLL